MFVSVYVTAKSKGEAQKLCDLLITRRLAACASIFPIESTYRWKGKVARAREYAIIAKTKKLLVRRLAHAVKEVHSYSVPCVVAWPIVQGDSGYLRWVQKETR